MAWNGCVGGTALCSEPVPHLLKVSDNYEASVKYLVEGGRGFPVTYCAVISDVYEELLLTTNRGVMHGMERKFEWNGIRPEGV